MAGKPNENDRSRTRRRRRYFVGLVAAFVAVSTIIIAGSAGAQVADGEIDVQVVVNNGSGGTAQSTDFAFQVDGFPAINWPLSGIVALILDVSVPHTITPVPHDGYTVTTSGCTNVTLDVTTPAFCRVTYTFIEPPPTAGAFLIGDKSAGNLAVGRNVNFWGSQWWRNNSLSGGSAPAALKGFTNSPTTATCGVDWSTRTGNSASPPPTLPSQIVVIVTSKTTKSGSTISGNTVHVVLVNVGPGYGPDPGHAGNGTIAATIC